ncbi:MAG: DUF977 family protein [Patescibacteria group bacterium]|nr:DUF977 family protein [Patescibacteria group bacterium]
MENAAKKNLISKNDEQPAAQINPPIPGKLNRIPPNNLPIIDKEKSEPKKSENKASEIKATPKTEAGESQSDKPAQIGEVVLPHQPNDLRPDEIIEIEQAAPEKIITDKDMEEAEKLEAYKLNPRVFLPTEVKNDNSNSIEAPSPKAEIDLAAHHQKKLKEIETVKQNITLQPAINEEINFMQKYLNKLTEFRTQANAKRREKKENNLKIIMNFARRKNKITNNEVEQLIGVKNTQASKYLKILLKQGKIVKFGKTKNTFYKPIK